jgi:hypothetical protein
LENHFDKKYLSMVKLHSGKVLYIFISNRAEAQGEKAMKKPIKYPKNFKLAVMAAFRRSDGTYDKDVQLLLKSGSPLIRTLLEAGIGGNRLPYTAIDVDYAFNHKGYGEMQRALIQRAIKKYAARIAHFGRLLRWYEDIHNQYLFPTTSKPTSKQKFEDYS